MDTLDALPEGFRTHRMARLVSRRMGVYALQAQGLSRSEARHTVFHPAADATFRQRNATSVLQRKIAAALGIPAQRRKDGAVV